MQELMQTYKDNSQDIENFLVETIIYYPRKNKQHFLNLYSKRAKITQENERVIL